MAADSPTPAPTIPPKLVFRRADAAAALGVSERQIDRFIATRTLRAVRLGGRAIGVSAAELQRFVDAGGVGEARR